MQKSIFKHRASWISIIALILALVIGISFFATSGSFNKISKEEAQQIIDNSLAAIGKKTAKGAQLILENTKITVNDIAYGEEKDIILSCSYTALNVEKTLSDKYDNLMQSVYEFYLENENAGVKINATKINLHIRDDIAVLLESAETVTGEITLYIYDTGDDMKLYLSEDTVNTITGGLITVSKNIREIKAVEYQGETVDISNMNTLRTGLLDCIALENFSMAKPETGNALQKAWADFKHDFYRNFIEDNNYQYLLTGLGTTLLLTLASAIFGIILGFIIAIIRCTNQMTGGLKFIDAICRLYLTVIRGTPVMVQLLILYFVVLLPLGVEKYTAAIICFGLNSGAYVAEIVRGGIMSIDKGQIEAGRSLGFNYVQTMVFFVVPQAFKAIVPSLANEFITLLKESSVAFTIGVADLTFGGNKIRSITYSPFLPLLAVALIYLGLVMILSKFVSMLERRLAKSDH